MLNWPKPSTSAATVIFDLDGTIADTAGDLINAANAALISEGFPPAPAEAIKKGVGYGSKAMLQSGLSALGHEADATQLQRLAGRLVANYEENIAVETRLYPGFEEAALNLHNSGAKLLLCTNKWEKLTWRLLSALGVATLFDAVAGRGTFPFHKPDPRHITELIRIAGGKLNTSLMVGDSEADVEAARGAGIPVIVTAFGYAANPAGTLGADGVMTHFGELPAMIEAWLPKSVLAMENEA
ncbi:MAG: HAD hydrolase-like protein [Rhodomicrobium sp.]